MFVNDIEQMGPLAKYAKRQYSQSGEDGIIEEIFNRLNITNGWFVEVGGNNGISWSNTRVLLEKGWNGVYIEGDDNYFSELITNVSQFKSFCFKQFINCETGTTLDDVLDRTPIPNNFDLLSLDIDSIDYWVWRGLKRQPKVLVVEYNCDFESNDCRTVEYSPTLQFSNTNYFGASLGAYVELGKEKGYSLVAVCHRLNLIFVENTYANLFETVDPMSIPRHSNFAPSEKQMIETPKRNSNDI